jgi:Flp pilus assembly protein CpaB
LNGLLSTRQGTLAAALISALLALGIIVYAVNQYRNSVSSSSKQETVLVASGLIQKGTSGDVIASQQLFTPTHIIQKQVTAGALADAAALRGKIAVADILPGTQLTAADFVAAGGITSQLAATQRAISVPIDQPHGLVGVLKAGDHVDVYGSYQLENNQLGSGRNAVVRLLASNVLVLQGPAASTGGIGSQQNATVVLEGIPKLDAELAFTADNGKVWLVLRPGNGSIAAGQTGATISSILSTLALNGATATGANP